jgi:putative aldouronate transport system permease protein
MSLTTLGAYAISKKTMWMRIITFFFVFTMWFAPGMIPFYLVVGINLNMKNTVLAMVIPRAIATYNMIVLRTGFMSVPDSLEESARIDGAHDLTILWRIYIPVCTANIAVVTLFYMVGTWNAWFDAVLFLTKRQLFPLQILLREILIINSMQGMMAAGGVSQGDQIGVAETIKYATIIIATIPILCVYPFIQKYFVKGVMIGAIKG